MLRRLTANFTRVMFAILRPTIYDFVLINEAGHDVFVVDFKNVLPVAQLGAEVLHNLS